ncbi:MAG: 2-amino-4-hydroxy-6-hydroxymethyldihydropteridine diphosphokinase [Bacteroidota bacterium]
MANLYLGLGTNQGDRLALLEEATYQCCVRMGTLTKASLIYETAAWGITEQEDFLNQCILIVTALPPLECLDIALDIEQQLGRERIQKWGPRTMDIDLLFYDQLVYQDARLRLPHPFMQDRRFVLRPLADIAVDLVHPELGRTITELLETCPDDSEVVRLEDNER